MSDRSQPPICPDCGQPMAGAGMALMEREDDGRRTCRAVWRCDSGHIWWNWADRGDALVPCPYPQEFDGKKRRRVRSTRQSSRRDAP